MDITFLILCPDRNIGGLKSTRGSINTHSWKRKMLAVVGDDATDTDLQELNRISPTIRAENTITSLINYGMEKIESEWAFILFSGSHIPPNLEKKIAQFAKKETDVLFPVIDRKCDFVSGSFNGVLINKKFFEKVGDFATSNMQKVGMNDFEMAKLLWALDAIEQGVTFKAIVGMKVI